MRTRSSSLLLLSVVLLLNSNPCNELSTSATSILPVLLPALNSALRPRSHGSGTSEDLFWKLDALQTFIRDLHWPEEEFGKHLETRLKLMSSDMIESCIKR